MNVVWEDVTSYARGERGKTEPWSWRATIGSVGIVVTKYMGWGDTWVCHCDAVNMDTVPLGEGLESSKEIAIAQVIMRAKAIRQDLAELIQGLGGMP